ncbi:MAG: phenylalanine--tRNA ligase subunit beta [Oscillospiraceae bacterium]|nr:phenylalanine--tRNA ligase subunit beta [Oscillospiraceae bacterium]
MNLSRKWLNAFVEDADITQISDKAFDEAMTLSGSKVEVTTAPGEEIRNVVVGKVVEIRRHENSDHMWICQLDIGKEAPVQIVTGAQNVKLGDVVPVAKHNSYLPGGVHITKGKLRGEKSEGMLCSLSELGLDIHDFPGAFEDGIFILSDDPELKDKLVPGEDVRPLLGLDDHVVEFEITPNRPDCLSVIGLAREVAATFDKPLKLHTPVVQELGKEELSSLLQVRVDAPELCPRYSSRMVRNVRIAPSPQWMRERLRMSGVRPINNIVDITNYVMLEYGQPMHAFDYRYVKGGKIIVRKAEDGETLTTLDGTVRKLTKDMLVIADETRAVGLAGIMGGENSEIVEDTVDVVFESANFDGTCIRRGALALGMRTEASAKFEKGLDPMNTVPALERACELVEMLGAGEVLPGMIDVENHSYEPYSLALRPEKINELLGTEIDVDTMCDILRKIGFGIDGETVTVPSWRGDVRHYSDLAEEVARFYGYNNLPTTLMRGETTRGGYTQEQLVENRLGTLCSGFGFDEILTYSFISPDYYDKIRWAADDPRRESFRILNPLGEDTSIMRTTTLPSMLEILSHNFNYRNRNVRLYELGRYYLPGGEDGLAQEKRCLSLGAYDETMDFYTLKGCICAILDDLRIGDVRFTACADNPSYHPGRCAYVFSGDTCLGVFGQIHPLVAQNYDMDTELYCAELSVEALFAVRGAQSEYVALPKYPAVMRDLALVCDESVTVGALEDCIKGASKSLLREIELFDIYRGPGIAEGKKSVAFSLILRADDRSLTAEEVDAEMATVLAALSEKLDAVLR